MGNWQREAVAGFVCEVFEPHQWMEPGYVILYLHDSTVQSPSTQPTLSGLLDRAGLAAVAPLTGRCWWANRPCPEFDATVTPEQHVLDNVLPHIQTRLGASPPRIGLLGQEMGGQAALRLAYKYPERFPVVAAVTPAIDYQHCYDEDPNLQHMYPDPESARQDTAILHIHPLNWPRHQFFCCDPADWRWWDGADRLRMKLYSLGIPHQCDLDTSHHGDAARYAEQMAERAVQFLLDGLQQEQRRIN